MKLSIYQIDAFATKVFEGNPAAVCPLDAWLPDETMQKIAMENNLSETAFFIKSGAGYDIRWFTPTTEVDFCGHATLATAYVIFNELHCKDSLINFQSRSGLLTVHKAEDTFLMDFPLTPIEPCETPQVLIDAFGIVPYDTYKCDDYMAVFDNEQTIKDLTPNLDILKKLPCRGVIATAKGDDVDFVSRFFAPRFGIDEDPVTGSAHTALAPYWGEKLGKTTLTAKQLSLRGGILRCEIKGDRIHLLGSAVKYLEGTIKI